MDNKDNKLAVEKIAKKLDKFKLDEVVMISELEENEVKNILDTLVEENVIIQNDDTYFYSKTKNKKTIQYSKNDYAEEIVLEELEGYDEYLKLKPCYKKTIDKKVKLIKLIHNLLGDDFKRTLDLYNSQNPNDTVGYSTATVYRNQFRNYGLRGLFPKIRGPKDNAAVDTIYETFKKYYLNTNKFSTEIALKLAQNELQNDGKIAFPLVHNAKSFYNKLIKELGKPSIEHLRNTAEFIIPDENKEVVTPSYKVVDITFKEAAANYLKNLSKLKKEERLLSEKTSYKNQIAYYFDDYKINEITPDVLREYKQEKYNSGYSVSSVKTYLALVKSIITHACPYKEQMAKQLEILSAIDMNILDKENEFRSNLSGGEKQRVAIARTLIMNPKLILFDEPTSSLDPKMTNEVLELIKKLKELHMTIILVSHELSFVKEIVERIIFIENGKIEVDTKAPFDFKNHKNKKLDDFLTNELTN